MRAYPLRELAEELGYSDPMHFARFFRRRAGVPPTAYRDEIGYATDPGRPDRRARCAHFVPVISAAGRS